MQELPEPLSFHFTVIIEGCRQASEADSSRTFLAPAPSIRMTRLLRLAGPLLGLTCSAPAPVSALAGPAALLPSILRRRASAPVAKELRLVSERVKKLVAYNQRYAAPLQQPPEP